MIRTPSTRALFLVAGLLTEALLEQAGVACALARQNDGATGKNVEERGDRAGSS